MSMKWWACCVAVVAVVAGMGWQRWSAEPPATASTLLFAQTLHDLKGEQQAFQQWRGKPLVLNFWATWCAPCVEEMPDLEGLHQKYAASTQFVGIGIDSVESMQAFTEKVTVSYPLLQGGMVGMEMMKQFGNRAGGLPYTVVLNEQGEVVLQHAGRIHPEQLEAVLGS
ncbi:MAG: TlpA family protein disulfide reductase [Pigmentiphaga sp.]|nr:TlpA family protein disulfide reductase [Pigmentiphaga sp.]